MPSGTAVVNATAGLSWAKAIIRKAMTTPKNAPCRAPERATLA